VDELYVKSLQENKEDLFLKHHNVKFTTDSIKIMEKYLDIMEDNNKYPIGVVGTNYYLESRWPSSFNRVQINTGIEIPLKEGCSLILLNLKDKKDFKELFFIHDEQDKYIACLSSYLLDKKIYLNIQNMKKRQQFSKRNYMYDKIDFAYAMVEDGYTESIKASLVEYIDPFTEDISNRFFDLEEVTHLIGKFEQSYLQGEDTIISNILQNNRLLNMLLTGYVSRIPPGHIKSHYGSGNWLF